MIVQREYKDFPEVTIFGIRSRTQREIYNILHNLRSGMSLSAIRNELEKRGIHNIETSVSSAIRKLNRRIKDFNYAVKWNFLIVNGQRKNSIYYLDFLKN